MNNKNTIIGLVLIFLIFIGYSYWMSPSKEEIAQQRHYADSLNAIANAKRDSAIAQRARQIATQSQVQLTDSTGAKVDPSIVKKNALKAQLGGFANAAEGTNAFYTLESEVIKMRVSRLGGKIDYLELKKYKSWDQKPLVIQDHDSLKFGISFFSNNRIINTNNLYFSPIFLKEGAKTDSSYSVIGKDSIQLAMRLYPSVSDTAIDQTKFIEFVYTLHGDSYMMGFKINFQGMENLIDPSTKFLVLNWDKRLNRQEKSLNMEKMNSTIYYKYYEDKVDYLSETKDEEKYLKNEKIKWISFKQQFFATSIISKSFMMEPKLRTATGPEHGNLVKSVFLEVGIPFVPTETKSVDMTMYYGPLKYYTLKSYKAELEKQIPLGWGFFLLAWINIYAVIPVFTFFGNLGWNYGIIILILTILLKIVLFPIAYKTYQSSAKMRALKPDIDELNKKFPKKEEAMKKQQATMDLYRKAGVNPMAGCVPLLLQMPILIAMFRFFPSSIELRQQAFLWADDLSSYDAIWTFPGGFSLPWYGDHVSLFALLMTISSIFYTRINDQMMGSQQSQMPGMKTMMYLMPVMFLFWFNDYSSGLSYYYLLANLLTFAQIYIIRATIDEKKLHAQIEANKKKPVKKSGFQKRLEAMAKQQGYKK